MKNANHISMLNELAASEGVFTTAQAQRLGITRGALSHACTAGRAERIRHGAYRLAGSPASANDELAAVWKLTDPARFTWERTRAWDGIVVGGTTAAYLLGIGDFPLSPYRIYSPTRINSRIRSAHFSVRAIDEEDVTWTEGLPVTRLARTLVDLCLDHEDPSLIMDALRDAQRQGFDRTRLARLTILLAHVPRNRTALALLEGSV